MVSSKVEPLVGQLVQVAAEQQAEESDIRSIAVAVAA